MKITYYLLLAFALLVSCGEHVSKQAKNSPEPNDFVLGTRQVIDTLYEIKSDDFFQLKYGERVDQNDTLIKTLRHQPISVWTYGKSGFLEFENDKIAKRAFQNLFNFLSISANRQNEYLISKSGISYWLANRHIVFKYGLCRTTYEIAITKSNQLKQHFLSGQNINHPHFIRFCCGCSSEYALTME